MSSRRILGILTLFLSVKGLVLGRVGGKNVHALQMRTRKRYPTWNISIERRDQQNLFRYKHVQYSPQLFQLNITTESTQLHLHGHQESSAITAEDIV